MVLYTAELLQPQKTLFCCMSYAFSSACATVLMAYQCKTSNMILQQQTKVGLDYKLHAGTMCAIPLLSQSRYEKTIFPQRKWNLLEILHSCCLGDLRQTWDREVSWLNMEEDGKRMLIPFAPLEVIWVQIRFRMANLYSTSCCHFQVSYCLWLKYTEHKHSLCTDISTTKAKTEWASSSSICSCCFQKPEQNMRSSEFTTGLQMSNQELLSHTNLAYCRLIAVQI